MVRLDDAAIEEPAATEAEAEAEEVAAEQAAEEIATATGAAGDEPVAEAEPVRVKTSPNWPSFRGENASGIAEGYPLPVTWDVEKGESLLWKTSIPGRAHSSPIIWGDRLFLTTARG
jgi:hypothetical protein